MHRLRLAVVALLLLGATAALVHRRAGTPAVVRSTTSTTEEVLATPSEPAPPTTLAELAPVPLPPPAVAPARLAGAAVVISPSGVALPVLGLQGDGVLVQTPCQHTVTVVRGTPLRSADVVLDAGHGGTESGAVGPNGLAEEGVNLAVVESAAASLRASGLSVVLTRAGDWNVTLADRALIATALHTKAFVSVHHNSEPDGAFPRPGSETYYQVASSESKRLSGLLYEEIVRALEPYRVAWVADRDAGAKYRKGDSGDDYYGVLRRSHGVPAALAELAFISNPPEAELLARDDVRQVEGQAVARAILRFLRTKDTGSGYVTPYPRTEPAGGGGGPEGCVDPPLG